MLGYLYILRSAQGRNYIGSTDDIQRRLAQHNRNLVKSTAQRGPWILVSSSTFSSQRRPSEPSTT
ncbi:MAG: hypothetical protein BWK77_02270 [Verrucomicrobia bacterium A1]|nr:MAG: hypothetical protein BWK77_02270 [Verrucomicrobia bacterium A1]